MAIERGLRSQNDAKPWRCRCGKLNKPTKHRFFDVPAFQCHSCECEFDGSFKFCLGEIKANGGSLIGQVEDQGSTRLCVPYAYSKAAEILERVSSVNNQTDPDKVRCFKPIDLEQKFKEKFPEPRAANCLVKDYGVHKVLHMGLILRDEGIERKMAVRFKADDLSTIARDDFEEIVHCLAEGIPLVATYQAGQRRSKLRYCQVYKSPAPPQKAEQYRGHAIVLIGAGMKNGKRFFYFLNSWGARFCPRKNKQGETKASGIGKIRAGDLTKNVIKLSQPDKTDPARRLKAQNEYDISKYNYLLMMGTKKMFDNVMSRRPEGDDNLSMLQCDDFDRSREDHLIHGAFRDDESAYPEAAEDLLYEVEASFTEMKGHLVEENLFDKLHHDLPASKESYHPQHCCEGDLRI